MTSIKHTTSSYNFSVITQLMALVCFLSTVYPRLLNLKFHLIDALKKEHYQRKFELRHHSNTRNEIISMFKILKLWQNIKVR